MAPESCRRRLDTRTFSVCDFGQKNANLNTLARCQRTERAYRADFSATCKLRSGHRSAPLGSSTV